MNFTFIIAIFMLVTGSLCEVKTEKANMRSKERRARAVAENGEEDEDEPQRLVCYLNFEWRRGQSVTNTIVDKSGYLNNAELKGKDGKIEEFIEGDYTCNRAANLLKNSRIEFKGEQFNSKPKYAITIAAWIKLEKKEGTHSIFSTVGLSHSNGQYHFEVNDGVLRWFHRNEKEQTIFETKADTATVPTNKWTHVAGTYDSKAKQAKVFIDGELKKQSIGQGGLSIVWEGAVLIGSHIGTRSLEGSVDEFRIYNYALNSEQIKGLVRSCEDGADSR